MKIELGQGQVGENTVGGMSKVDPRPIVPGRVPAIRLGRSTSARKSRTIRASWDMTAA